MARTLSATMQLTMMPETALGVPATSGGFILEPNNVTEFGAKTKKVARNPWSVHRSRRKGAIVGLDSTPKYETDATMEILDHYMGPFCFAKYAGPAEGLADGVFFRPTAVTSTGYTVAASGDIANGTLFRAFGFRTAANNGLKVAAGTSTSTEIKCTGLTAEASPPANVMVAVCGIQGGSGDLEIDASGNLISTTLDFTTLGWKAGQWIWIGGALGGALVFANANNRGFARIVSIAAHVVVLDKKATTFAEDDGAGKTIQIFFGNFARNVPKSSAEWQEASFTKEMVYEDLASAGTDSYEYARGNYCAKLTFNMPKEDKATIAWEFVGVDCDNPTTSRATGFSAAREPLKTEPLNTTADVVRLRVTEMGETAVATAFSDCKLSINNNVNAEKVIGRLGAAYVNYGRFEIDVDTTTLLDDPDIISAVRNNTTLTMEWCLRNADGGVVFDVPEMTVDTDGKEFPENETVKFKAKCMAHRSAVFGHDFSASFFPYLPSA